MMIFLLLLILIIFAIREGGSEEKMKFLYHGSIHKIAILEPRPSAVLKRKNMGFTSAVFATSSYVHAIIFATGWSDYHFDFGRNSQNGPHFLIEQFPGAINEKLKKSVYVHYLDKNGFQLMPGGMRNEYVNPEPVKPSKIELIKNAFKEISKSKEIKVVKYADRKIKKRERLARYHITYLDVHEEPPEFPPQYKMADIYSGQKGDILFGLNILIDYEATADIGYVIEKKYDFHPSVKTSKHDFDRFIEAQRKHFKNYHFVTLSEMQEILKS